MCFFFKCMLLNYITHCSSLNSRSIPKNKNLSNKNLYDLSLLLVLFILIVI